MNQQFSLESLEPRLLLSAMSFVESLDLTTTAGLIQLEYNLPALQVEQVYSGEAESLSQVVLGDVQLTGGTGQVMLPSVTTQLVIPYGYELADVLIETGERIVLDGQYTLTEGGMLIASDGETTASMEWIDRSDGYEVVGVFGRRGVDILVLNFYPVEYAVETGTLSYFDSLALSVQLTPSDSASGQSHDLVYRSDDIRPLSEQVDNPAALASYEAAEGMQAAPLGALVDPADSYDYVIITNNALATASADYDMADFIAHKESVGYSVAMVTVEDIYANYTGVDQQEQIRNFIIDAYNGWETNFVLLAGDSSVIPLRKLLVPGNAPDLIDSDMYYQGLDGDWNANGNWAYGEHIVDNPDYLSDVYLGRAAFDDVTKMSNWVYKTISYENTVKDPYRYNALMVGEYIDANTWSQPALDIIRNGQFSKDPAFQVDTLYAKDQAWDTPEIIAEMNSDTHAIYNHLGHSNGGIVMQTTQAEYDAQLTNEKFFFIYSQGCWPGYMGPGGSVGEHLTTHTRNGAAALMFNSTYGWYYSGWASGPSQDLNVQFWDALFSEGINQIGAMNADSHADNLGNIGTWYYRAVIYGTTIFGDPSLEIISFDMAISTAPDLSVAYQDEYYAVQLETRNGVGPYGWSVTAGVLPDGLALNASTGLISGTPTGLPDETFTVEVIDSFDGATDSETFNLTVVDRLEMQVGVLADGNIDVYYSVSLNVAGGTGPYMWALAAGALPDGLQLNANTGLLDGTPTVVDSFNFTVEVTDSGAYQQMVSRAYAMEVTVLAPGIYGQVFRDTNGNGTQEAGEVGLNGWTIELLDLATGAVAATTTSASVDTNGNGVFDAETEVGLYSFTGVSAGHYEVRQIDNTGWDPTTVVTFSDRLFTLRNLGTGLIIVENDPNTGLVINSFAAPVSTFFGGMQGLALGDGGLYFIDSSNPTIQPVLYELNPETGVVTDSSSIPGSLPMMTLGLGVIDYIVYVQTGISEIKVFNCATSQIIDTLTIPSLVGGLTAAEDLGLLFGSDSSGNIFAIDPATGAVMNTLTPIGVGNMNGGMAYVNGELIVSAKVVSPGSVAYRIDPLTGAVLGTIVLYGDGNITGLAGDARTLPTYGTYRIRMETGDIVQDKNFGNSVQLLGDADASGVIDSADIDLVLRGFGDAGTIAALHDMDGDGDVDSDDADMLVRGILNSEYGDADLDGDIDTTDLAILATFFGIDNAWSRGDFNGDNLINTTDLTTLATNFGFIAGPLGASLGIEPPAGSTVESGLGEDVLASTFAVESEPIVVSSAVGLGGPAVLSTNALTVTSSVRPTSVALAAADLSTLAEATLAEATLSEPGSALPLARASEDLTAGELGATNQPITFRLGEQATSLSPAIDMAIPPVELTDDASAWAGIGLDSAVAGLADTDLVNVLDEVEALL